MACSEMAWTSRWIRVIGPSRRTEKPPLASAGISTACFACRATQPTACSTSPSQDRVFVTMISSSRTQEFRHGPLDSGCIASDTGQPPGYEITRSTTAISCLTRHKNLYIRVRARSIAGGQACGQSVSSRRLTAIVPVVSRRHSAADRAGFASRPCLAAASPQIVAVGGLPVSIRKSCERSGVCAR
jgi:hypothetical protein